MGAPYDVFLSYHTDDPVGEWVRESFARELQTWLKEQFGDRGVRVFLDRDAIEVGDRYDESLLTALTVSRIFVPVLSPSYFNLSKWCKWEWDCFRLLRADGVMPVLYYNLRSLPADVQMLHMEDFSELSDVNPGWKKTLRYSEFTRRVRLFAERIAARLQEIGSAPLIVPSGFQAPPIPIIAGMPAISQRRMAA